MVHCSQFGSALHSTLGKLITDKGAMGVQLFFIASAFTLFLSFSKRNSMEQFPVRNFFIRRFFRIAPIFYIAICYYLFQNWHSGRNVFTPGVPHVFDIVSNFLFVNGFSPYSIRSIVPGGWSIAVEITFYAVLPFLYSKIKNEKHAFNFFVIALILNFIFTTILQKFPLISETEIWNNFLYFNFINQLPVFALGILFFFIATKPTTQTFVFNAKTVLFFVLICLLQLAVGIPFFLPYHIFFSVFFTVFAIALHFKQPVILVNRIINYIGTVSFSMYIIHFAVLYWLTYFNKIDFVSNQFINYGLKFIVVTGITITISSVTYYLIEVPFQSVGKKIILGLETKMVSAQPPSSSIVLHD